MSQTSDLVVAYLDTLHRQRELVAAAYHRGSVTRSDGFGTARGIYELHQHRTLVPYTQESFRLASSLIRHLDEVLQKEQMYAAVGANIGELAERLPLLIDETIKAHLEGRTEDADTYAGLQPIGGMARGQGGQPYRCRYDLTARPGSPDLGIC